MARHRQPSVSVLHTKALVGLLLLTKTTDEVQDLAASSEIAQRLAHRGRSHKQIAQTSLLPMSLMCKGEHGKLKALVPTARLQKHRAGHAEG